MPETLLGKCHCGAVEFTLTLKHGWQNLRRCNCSLCRRRGAIMGGVPLHALRVTRGADNLALYQWNTRTARHYFCKTCGIYTHHARRSNPDEYGVNIGCLDAVDTATLGEIPTGDGRVMSLAADLA